MRVFMTKSEKKRIGNQLGTLFGLFEVSIASSEQISNDTALEYYRQALYDTHRLAMELGGKTAEKAFFKGFNDTIAAVKKRQISDLERNTEELRR